MMVAKTLSAQAEPAGVDRRSTAHADRPVFVADFNRRERAVKTALTLTGALLLVWLVALVAGVLGLGNLPALPVPGSAPSRPQVEEGATKGGGALETHVQARADGRTSGETASRRGGSGEPAASSGDNAAPGTESHPVGNRSAGEENVSHRSVPRPPAAEVGGTSPNEAAPTADAGVVEAQSTAPHGADVGVVEAQSTAPRGAPTVTPSGNEIPAGSPSASTGKSETGKESAGGAHSAAAAGG
jgi:cytoskeletal protein RodZ